MKTSLFLLLCLSISTVYSQNPHRYIKWVDYNFQSQNAFGAFFNDDQSITLLARNFTTSKPTKIKDAKLLKYKIDLKGKATLNKIVVDSFHEFIPSNLGSTIAGKSDFIITGTLVDSLNQHDGIIAKYDKDFNLIWKFILNPGKHEYIRSYDIDSDGNIYVGGNINNSEDLILFKLDKDGKEIWQKALELPIFHDFPLQILVMDDNHVVINIQNGGLYDFWHRYKLICLDSNGLKQWENELLEVTYVNSFNRLVKYDEKQIVWYNFDQKSMHIYNITADSGLIKSSLSLNNGATFGEPILTKDKCIISLWSEEGGSSSLVKFNKYGDKLWSRPFPSNRIPQISGTILTPDNGVFIYGNDTREISSSHPDSTFQDIWYMRTDSLGCVMETCVSSSFPSISNDKPGPHFKPGSKVRENIDFDSDTEKISIFPNPVSDELTITWPDELGISRLTLYDNYGKIALQNESRITNSTYHMKLSELPGGLYYLRLENTEGVVAISKILKQ